MFHRAQLNEALTYNDLSIFVEREEVANMIVALSKLSNQFRISTALVDPVLRRQSSPTDLLIASKVCQNWNVFALLNDNDKQKNNTEALGLTWDKHLT